MIGAGLFLGIGNSIHVAVPGGVILTFSLNGLIVIFTTLSYAELSSANPLLSHGLSGVCFWR